MKNTHKLYTDVIAKSGSKNEPLEVTANGTYEAPKGTGYSPVKVNVKLEGNPLQYVIDNRGGDGKPSCEYLFYKYKGASLDSALSAIDTSSVTSMFHMFDSCSNLKTIPILDTSSVTNMENMFHDCNKLTTIPLLDTSSVTTMYQMFYRCYNLKTIPLLDTSSVTSMSNTFDNCKNLTTIPLLNTSNVNNMSSMFSYCSSLISVPQLNASQVTNFRYMFSGCSKLTSIGIYGFRYSIDITPTALEHDAIVALLNQAGTAYNSSQKITMGSAKLALLSDEEKAIATNKGWTLA